MTSHDLDFFACRSARISARSAPLLWITTLATLLGLTGCTSPGPLLPQHSDGSVLDEHALVEIETQDKSLLWLSPDHQLGRYDALLIEDVGFRYEERQRWLSDRDERRIQKMLVSSVRGSNTGGLSVSSEPGPCVVGVRFFVVDLELNTPLRESTSTTSFVDSFGEATLILELSDSETERPLARFVQRRKLGGGQAFGQTTTSLRRLERVVARALRDMGRQLQALTPRTTKGWDAECQGGLTRVALGSH